MPKVKVGGVWKDASGYVKAGGLWYQTTSSGINVIIDSATTLYDFNLKTYMQGAGIWPASGPVVINELTVTARTYITTTPRVKVPFMYETLTDTPIPPIPYTGFKWERMVVPVKSQGTNQNSIMYRFKFAQDLARYAFKVGDGWPVGSVINKFNVLGFIYGQGGDGDCDGWELVPGGVNYNWYANDGLYPTTNVEICPSGHGDHALHTSNVPITTLAVSGGVYGGGAGGNIGRYINTKGSDVVQTTYAPPLVDVPVDLAEFWSANTATSLGGNGLGLWHIPQVGVKGNVQTATIEYALWRVNGCGGGQGGGRGGSIGGTRTVIRSAPQPGGAGTFAAKGACPSNLVDYDEAGEKITLTYKTTYVTGPQAGAWGEDSSPGQVYDNQNIYSLTSSVVDRVLTGGTAKSSYIGPYKYIGGTAIQGRSSITTITDPTKIKGRLK